MALQPKLSLPDAVHEILKSFPELVMEHQFRTDTVLIRKRGSGEHYDDGDVVGRYGSDSFDHKQLSTDDIREDCEAFCHEKKLPFFPRPAT